jgi:hypothetical protein
VVLAQCWRYCLRYRWNFEACSSRATACLLGDAQDHAVQVASLAAFANKRCHAASWLKACCIEAYACRAKWANINNACSVVTNACFALSPALSWLHSPPVAHVQAGGLWLCIDAWLSLNSMGGSFPLLCHAVVSAFEGRGARVLGCFIVSCTKCGDCPEYGGPVHDRRH